MNKHAKSIEMVIEIAEPILKKLLKKFNIKVDDEAYKDLLHGFALSVVTRLEGGKNTIWIINKTAYMERSIRNYLIDNFKRKKRVSFIEDIQSFTAKEYSITNGVLEVEDSIEASKNIEEKERKSIVQKLLSKLKPLHQNLVKGKYFFGKSYRELATEYHISEANVANIVSRSLVKMKKQARKGGLSGFDFY